LCFPPMSRAQEAMDIPSELARCLADVEQLAEMEVPDDTSSDSSPRGDDSMDDDNMDDDTRFCIDSSDAEGEPVQRPVCPPPLRRAHEEVMSIPPELEEEDSDAPVNAPYEASSLWRPGHDCGSWVHQRWSPCQQQTQVLLVNLVLVLENMGREMCKTIYQRICPGRRKRHSYVIDAAAGLMCMGASTVQTIFQKLRLNSWVPHWIPQSCRKRARADVEPEENDRSQEAFEEQRRLNAMSVLVREGLACAFEGGTDQSFLSSLSRLRCAGVELGTKYHQRRFQVLLEELVTNLLRSASVDSIKCLLPGLLTPSDFSVVFDGVSIGTTSFSTNETLNLIGVRSASSQTGDLHTRLMAAPSQGVSHKGEHTKDLVLDSLRSCPQGGFDRRRLRRSMVTVGGDGAVTKGGSDARHSSTKACELLYQAVFPHLPFTLTWWDLFHRSEVSGRWAVKRTPYAIEIFDVSQVMVQLFGVGSGRVVLRGISDLFVSEQDGSRFQDKQGAIKPSGGQSTRPIAYAYRVCESLYRNYPFYFEGLKVRLEYTRGSTSTGEKHGSQSLKKLVDVGHRMCALDFVAFFLLHRDISDRVLKPFAQAAQDDSLEGVEAYAKCAALTEQLRVEADVFDGIRWWMWLTVMLLHCLRSQDLVNLWRAVLYTNAGRKYPTLVRHMYDLLCEQRFKGCPLQWDFSPKTVDPTKFRMVHPRCQCAAMCNRPGPGLTCMTQMPYTKRKGIDAGESVPIDVPSWATQILQEADPSRSHMCGPTCYPQCHSSITNVLRNVDLGLSRVLPRFCLEEKFATPSFLQGIPRYHGYKQDAPFRCMIPLPVLPCYLQLLQILDAFRDFLEEMAEQFGGYFGSIGTNDTMKTLLDAVSVCWDWQLLAHAEPQRRHIQALNTVYKILRPTLADSFWPPPTHFQHVHPAWPSQRDLGIQYCLLCWRVRRAMSGEDGQMLFSRFTKVVQYRVLPLPCPAYLVHLVAFRICSGKAGYTRVAWRIQFCLSGWPAGGVGSADADFVFCQRYGLCARSHCAIRFSPNEGFRVKASSLCQPGHAQNWKKSRARRRHLFSFAGSVGDVAQVNSGPLCNTIVYVLEEERLVNVGKLASNFDMDPSWHLPLPPTFPNGCYHLVKLGHRMRFLCPPETPMETSGSLLHVIYNDMAREAYDRIRQRLFIKEAGLRCAGSARDEAIVRVVAELLIRSGCDPFTRQKQTRLPHSVARLRQNADARHWKLGEDVDDATMMDYLDPSSTSVPAALRAPRSFGVELDPVVAQSVRRSFEKTSMGNAYQRDHLGHKHIKAMPLYANELRHQSATRSVWRERLQAWLRSEDGQQWSDQRTRFEDPDADDV
jgi:hypothetical protein